MKTASIINDVGIPRQKLKTKEEKSMRPPKLLRTVAFSILTFLFAVAMGVNTSFAQDTYYVDATNGDDNNNGTSETDQGGNVGPFQTIGAALAVDGDGDTIVIKAANTPGYSEGGTLTFDSDVTVRLETVDNVDQILVTASDWTFDADVTFENLSNEFLTISNAATVTLESGAVDFGGVTVETTNGTINVVREGGSLTEAFDYQSGTINITYDGSANLTSGAELPSSLGNGTLTNTGTAGNVSIAQSVTANDFVQDDASSTSFSSDLTVTGGNVAITDDGDFSVSGDLDLNNNTLAHGGNGDVSLNTVTVNDGEVAVTSAGNFEANSVTFSKPLGADFTSNILNLTGNGSTTINNSLSVNTTSDNDNAGDIITADINHAGAGTLTVTDGVKVSEIADGAAVDRTRVTYTGNTADATFGASTFDTFSAGTGTSTFTANSTIDSNFSNGGTVDIGSTTLTLSGLLSATHNNNDNQVTGSGLVVFDDEGGNHTVNNAGDLPALQVDQVTTLEDGTAITVNGNVTASDNFTLNNDAAAATIDGNMSTTGGTTTLGNGQAVNVTGNVTNSATFATGGNIDVDGDFENSGSGSSTFNNDVEVNGDFTNTSSSNTAVTFNGANNDVDGTFDTNDGEITSNNDLTVGNFNISGVNTVLLDMAGNVLTTEGSFTRTGGDVDNASTFAFTTSNAGSFTAGPQLDITNLSVNKPNETLSITQTIRLDGDFTVTDGTVALGTNRIRMEGNGVTSDLDGAMTTSGGGGITFEGPNPGGAGETIANIQGDGVYTNIRIDLDGNDDNVSVGGGENVKFSGLLELISGGLDVAGDFSPSDDITFPTISRNLAVATTDIELSGGSFNADGQSYDLTYTGTLGADQLVGSEFDDDQIRNLKVSTLNNGALFPASSVTILGNVEVTSNAILVLDGANDAEVQGTLTIARGGDIQDGNAANALELSGTATHSILGSITAANALTISGNNSSVEGSTDEDDQAALNNVVVDNGVTTTFENIQEVNGTFTTNATSNTTFGMFEGTNAGEGEVDGNITLGGASFTLASNVQVNADVDHNVGSVNFDSFNLDLVTGGADFDGANGVTYTANGGALVLTGAATSFGINGSVIPNVTVDGTTTLDSDVEVSGLLDIDADIADGGNDLTLSGDAEFAADITGGGTFITTGTTLTAEADVSINRMEVNSSTTTTFANTGGAKTFTITGQFDHTQGGIDLGVNTLLINNPNYNYVAGTYAMTSGAVEFAATGGDITLDTGGSTLTIPNVVIDDQGNGNDVVLTAGDELNISNKLTLTDGDLDGGTTNNTASVSFADGSTIERQMTTSTLTDTPTYGTDMTIMYTGNENANMATANELPATVSTLTVNRSGLADDVDLTSDLTVNDNLNLMDGDLDEAGGQLTFASGLLVTRTNGSLKDTPSSTNYDLTYAADNNVGNELVSGNIDQLTLNTGVDLTLSGAVTVDNVTMTGSSTMDLNASDFTFTGDLGVGNGNAFTNSGANADLVINGTDAQTITVPSGGLTLPGDGGGDPESDDGDDVVNVTLDNSAGATLDGGDLIFGENGVFTFTEGILMTDDDNAVDLFHYASDGTNPAIQGFDRSATDAGHVMGNVRKTLPSTATQIPQARVEYPVGGNDVDPTTTNAEDEFSPVAFTFNDARQIPAGVEVTVGHFEVGPNGANNLPLADGIEQGEDLTRYPDEFHWRITGSTSLSPSVEYDLELQRQGYSEFVIQDQQADMEDMRIIRRAGTNVDNDWLLLGSGPNSYLQNYATGTAPDVYPTAIVTGVTGNIIGGDGSIFTYGLKSNMFTNEPNAITFNVGQTVDLDIRENNDDTDVIHGGTGEYTYSISGNDANIATASENNDVVTFTAVAEGTTTFTITATDELNDQTSVDVTVNVNPALANSAALPDTTVNQGASVDLTLSDYFTPGTGPLTYAVSTSDAAVATASESSGTLTVSAVAMGTATITVDATDATGATVSDSFEITVNGTIAATGNVNDQSLETGDQFNDAGTFSVADITALFTGGTAPYTYTVTENSSDTTVSVATDSNELTVTATGTGISTETATVTISATDSFGESASLSFDVTTEPSIGDVTADAMVNSTDATSILYNRIGSDWMSTGFDETNMTATQQTAADVDQANGVNSFDAAVILRYAGQFTGYTSLPYSPKSSPAALAYGDSKVVDGMATVPVKVEGNSITSVEFFGEFDANSASLETLELNGLPDDWVVAKSTDEEGKVKFALAGITPISTAEVATLTFKLNGKSSDVALTSNGFVNNSRFANDELSVKELPESFALEQNYPNPFNPTTNVRYDLPASADVTVELYSMNGQKVQTLVSKRQDAGTYTLTVDGSSLASGVYMYRITAKTADNTFTSIKKMTLIK